jgi:hypothetical protein
MNRIARTLITALPLSAAALSFSTGIAHAETPAPAPGPVIVLPAEPVEPPSDFANPTPAPPKDIANPDPAPEPEPNPAPETSDEITDVPDCTHGCQEDPTPDLPLDNGDGGEGEETPDFPLDGGCFSDCDLPEEPADEPKETEEVDAPEEEVANFRTFTTPTRVDAGLADHDDNGLQLTWLLASGALVTAGGATLVARKRAQKA